MVRQQSLFGKVNQMKIQVLLERIFTGRKVRFSEGELESGGNTGNKVLVVTDEDSGKKYILYRSITNFVRFQRWIGKGARADIAPISGYTKYKVDGAWLTPIRMKTVVEVERTKRSGSEAEMDWGYSYDFNPEEPPDIRQGHAGTE